MNLDLGNLLPRAWKITWNNKILWLFGILAALGNGGLNFRGSDNANYRTDSSDFSDFPNSIDPYLRRFQDWLNPNVIAIGVAIICVLLLVSLAIWLISLVGRGGLIGGVRQADTSGRVTFGEAWASGTRHLVRLILVQLPTLLLGVLILLIVLVPTVILMITLSNNDFPALFGSLLGLLACLFILVCPIAIASVLLNILIHFARFAVVLESRSPVEAYRRAWEVIKTNATSILVLGIILIVADLIISVIIGLPALIIIVPAVIGLVTGILLGQGLAVAAGVVFALICCAIYTPVAIVLRGVFETWATSVWTLAYQQFIQPAAAPSALYPAEPPSYPA